MATTLKKNPPPKPSQNIDEKSMQQAIAEVHKVFSPDFKQPDMNVLELVENVNSANLNRPQRSPESPVDNLEDILLDSKIEALVKERVDQWLENNMHDIIKEQFLQKLANIKDNNK